MPTFISPVDSACLFYRDYVPGDLAHRPRDRPSPQVTLVLLHGWPMSSGMWEHLLVPLCETHRFRCVAPDRRGFGKSDWNGADSAVPITAETSAADVTALLDHLKLGAIVLVGASMGCGESVRAYLASPFVQERCKGFIWISPNMPYPIKCPESPLSITPEYSAQILDDFRAARADFVFASMPGIFALQAGNTVGPKTLERFERLVDQADGLALERTAVISQLPLVSELRRLGAAAERVPVLILHGSCDQAIPVDASSRHIVEILPWAELKVYENGGHGLYLTHSNRTLEDIVSFVDGLAVCKE